MYTYFFAIENALFGLSLQQCTLYFERSPLLGLKTHGTYNQHRQQEREKETSTRHEWTRPFTCLHLFLFHEIFVVQLEIVQKMVSVKDSPDNTFFKMKEKIVSCTEFGNSDLCKRGHRVILDNFGNRAQQLKIILNIQN